MCEGIDLKGEIIRNTRKAAWAIIFCLLVCLIPVSQVQAAKLPKSEEAKGWYMKYLPEDSDEIDQYLLYNKKTGAVFGAF